MREIALDTETTGLDPLSGHRIVEIGCVEMVGRLRTGNSFHIYLNPQREMDAEAQAVHGITKEFLADKPFFRDAAPEFLNFIGDDPLIIHNAAFDLGFLNAELNHARMDEIPFGRAIDTVTMARMQFPGAPTSLDSLCRRFEISLEERELHGALLDAELLADVYLELTGGRQSSLELAGDKFRSKSASEKPFHPPRAHVASAEELAAHAKMLETLQNPLWLQQQDQAA